MIHLPITDQFFFEWMKISVWYHLSLKKEKVYTVNKFLANYTFQEAIVLPQQLKNKLGSLPPALPQLIMSDKQIAEACFRYFGVKNLKRACHRLDPTQFVHNSNSLQYKKQGLLHLSNQTCMVQQYKYRAWKYNFGPMDRQGGAFPPWLNLVSFFLPNALSILISAWGVNIKILVSSSWDTRINHTLSSLTLSGQLK